MLNGILGSLSRTVRNVPVAQHGFYAGPSAHLRPLATLAGLGTIFSNSGIVRFVQGGVVKTFRWASSHANFGPVSYTHLTLPTILLV